MYNHSIIVVCNYQKRLTMEGTTIAANKFFEDPLADIIDIDNKEFQIKKDISCSVP